MSDEVKWRCEIESVREQAEWYDRKYEEMGGCWHTPPEDLDWHLAKMGMFSGASVLEIGSGDGSLLIRAQERYGLHDGLGFDLSSYAVTKANQKAVDLPLLFSCEDLVPRLPFGAWDFIISMGSLEHVIELEKCLQGIRQSLKPSGKWYFYLPTDEWIHKDQPNERTATPEAWASLFRSNGLRVDGWEVVRDNVAMWGGAQ